MTPPDPSSTGSLFRRLVALALPMVVSTGSTTVMQFVDRMFLSWHSADAARAGMPAGFLALNFIIGPMMLAGITSTLAAQYCGAGNPRAAARATAQGVWMSLLCWPLLVLAIPGGFALIDLAGHPEGVRAAERTYFGILLAFGVSSVLKSALGGFFSGIGRPSIVMWANLASNALNILLDYLLIFGKGGAPEMGVAGAAIATVVSEAACVAIYLLAYRGRSCAAFHTREEWGYDPALMRSLVRFGLPSGVHMTLEFAAFSVFLLLTGRLGPEEAVASNIALNVNHIAVMPILGISFAASTLVGQYQGAGDHVRAARAGWCALGLGQGLMLLAGLSFVLLPDLYAGLYAREALGALDVARIHELTRTLLIILAAWGLFDTCNLILAGALRGAGDTRFVMTYSLAVAWLAYLPALVWLACTGRAHLLPMWLCTAGWVAVLAVGFLIRFARGRWTTIDVVGPSAG